MSVTDKGGDRCYYLGPLGICLGDYSRCLWVLSSSRRSFGIHSTTLIFLHNNELTEPCVAANRPSRFSIHSNASRTYAISQGLFTSLSKFRNFAHFVSPSLVDHELQPAPDRVEATHCRACTSGRRELPQTQRDGRKESVTSKKFGFVLEG